MVKYSTAFRHEWHVHGTVALVFSTKLWYEQKGHLLATIINVRVGYLHPVVELQATPEALLHIWSSQLKHCPLRPHFVVKFMKAARIVPSPPPFFFYLWPGSVMCMFPQSFWFYAATVFAFLSQVTALSL